MSRTQQACNWDDQNMVEVTQMFLQCKGYKLLLRPFLAKTIVVRVRPNYRVWHAKIATFPAHCTTALVLDSLYCLLISQTTLFADEPWETNCSLARAIVEKESKDNPFSLFTAILQGSTGHLLMCAVSVCYVGLVWVPTISNGSNWQNQVSH